VISAQLSVLENILVSVAVCIYVGISVSALKRFVISYVEGFAVIRRGGIFQNDFLFDIVSADASAFEGN